MSKNPGLDILCGTALAVENDAIVLSSAAPLPPFDEGVTRFLAALSAALLATPETRAYPDVTTFAFFCRRASLERMRAEYDGALLDRVGLGTAFHIAPGNVPVNFAYSLVASLLSGNQSVVKASSRGFEQTRMLCAAMDALFRGEFAPLAPYVSVITYPRELQELTRELSLLCDVRVIWGGDETVRRVREAPLPPRSFDLTFADRFSLLMLNARAVLAMDEKQLVNTARGFYNDTYLTDQNACTAPRLAYWVGVGKDVEEAQERFWAAVHAYVSPRYPVEPVLAVDKLTAAYNAAIAFPGARLMPMPDNLIVRVALPALTPALDSHRAPGGFFLEYASETMEALAPVVKRNYQTLSYLGMEPEALLAFVRSHGLRGIDRVVPVGHTMDFSLTWDGYDLIRTLSRRLSAF